MEMFYNLIDMVIKKYKNVSKPIKLYISSVCTLSKLYSLNWF